MLTPAFPSPESGWCGLWLVVMEQFMMPTTAANTPTPNPSRHRELITPSWARGHTGRSTGRTESIKNVLLPAGQRNTRTGCTVDSQLEDLHFAAHCQLCTVLLPFGAT